MAIDTKNRRASWQELTDEFAAAEARLREGGGSAGQARQQRLGRLPVRERLRLLFDENTEPLELGLWAAHGMYESWGDVPAAGIVTTLGRIHGRACMVIANDATVKAGAFFPQTVKKFLRAQRIAFECNLPTIYVVDSAGVFLPMQDEVFPDEDDFGRIFRNNAVMSAAGVPQYAAIMGDCIAGGGYLPVLCDKLLMTEGSGLYLAGPALVKAAIGQEVDAESLGGAAMHAEISGTIDFHEPDEPACLARLRSLIDLLPAPETANNLGTDSERNGEQIYDLIEVEGRAEFDVSDLLRCIVDRDSFQEYKAEYGRSLVTGYAKLGGRAVGIVANQRMRVRSKKQGIQLGGVLYPDSADKAARFVMTCNQSELPLVFLQDVVGFMVGKDSEESGIIRRGAKLVNAVSNSVVPKITMIIGNSYGAGNYALCGKAYDPRFIFAWPNARCAVMGGDQAADTLFTLQKRAAERHGVSLDDAELERLHNEVRGNYQAQADIRYAAARGWVDAIVSPHATRATLIIALELACREAPKSRFSTGVFQV